MESSRNSQQNKNRQNSSGDKSLDNLTANDYLRIIKELEQREAELTDQLNDIRQQEENARKVSEEFRLLGKLTAEMLELETLTDIYNYITTFLQKQIPDSVILFNSVDEKEQVVKLESISGIKSQLLNKILGIWGINPVGMKFRLITTHDEYFRSGQFVEFRGKLEDFAVSSLSPLVARAIEKLIRLHKIYTIGIMKDTTLLAAIHFLSFNKHVCPDTNFIETFIRQAGVVLQKKLAEVQLKESEEKYRSIFENVQDVYYEATLNGIVLEVSPSVENFSKGQYTRNDLIGKSLYNFFDDNSEFDNFLTSIKENGKLFGYEISLKNKDGKLIPSLVNAKIEMSENGSPVKIVGSASDISVRKEFENALKMSEQKYREIFMNSPVGIWEEDFSEVKARLDYLKQSGVTNLRSHLDSDPEELRRIASLVKVQSVNEESLKTMGYELNEVIENDLNNLFNEDSIPVFKEEIIALSEGKTYFKCELPVSVNKGERLFQLSLAVPENYTDTLSRVLVSFLDITEQKKAAKEISASEKRYRSLFDKMQEGFALHEIICDENGNPCNYRFLDVNPAFEQLTGVRSEAIRGKTVLEVFPETEHYWIEKYGNVALKGEFIQFENYSKAVKRYFHVVAFCPDKNQFATMFSDITSSKLAEINLLQTKESYFDVFNSVAEAIYIQDKTTTRFIDVNKGAELMYGGSREELIGQSHETFSAPGLNDSKNIKQYINHTFDTGEPTQFEFWAIRKNGDTYPKEVILNKGRYFGQDVIIATARDITESKMAQEQLIRQAKFRQLLIEISSNFINLPLDKLSISINNALEVMGRFAGVDRTYIFDFDDVTGLCTNTYEWCNDGIAPQINELQNIPLSAEWIESFRNGKIIYVDDVLSLPEGDTRAVLEPQGIKSLVTVPMMDKDVCIGFIGLDSVRQHHNFTEVDHQLLIMSAQLLVNIKLRTITEENIIKAKEKAEESDRLKSAFLANMSHEIRTPLNSIIGFSELLTDPNFDQNQRAEFAQMINENGNNLLTILSDIMDLSKIEAGQMQIKKMPFVVNKLVAEMQREFSFKAFKKGIELKVDLLSPATNVLINSDESKIRQILVNLISNALKFTHQGSIEIGFRIIDNQVCIHVKDTGIGIPAEFHQQIFERFRQVDLSRARKYGGNGLGLAISKSLVEIMNGKIWVESEVNHGSVFYFTIPMSF